MITLGLGLAAVCTIFAVVDTVLLRPLGYDHPERIVTVAQRLPPLGPGLMVGTLDEFHEWQRSGLLEQTAAMDTADFTLTGSGRAERLYGMQVTPDFFRVFRVQPILGRGFRAEDATPGHDQVIVLSHQLWSRDFGADPAIVGRTIPLAGGSKTVLGVMPPGFDFPRVADVRAIMHWAPEQSEFWTPLVITPQLVEQGNFNYYIFGRLRDGVTAARASQQFRASAVALFHQLEVKDPGWRDTIERMLPAFGVAVIPLAETMSLGIGNLLWMLLGAVALLLVLVLFNLGNLLLTRNANRLREYAVREALGASRWQIVRQSLAEQAIVVSAAAVLSLVLAWAGVVVVRAVGAARLPRLYEMSFDLRMVAVLMLLAAVVALLFGAVPLLVLRGSDPGDALHSETRGSTGDRRTSRLKSVLMVSEIAVSTFC